MQRPFNLVENQTVGASQQNTHSLAVLDTRDLEDLGVIGQAGLLA